MCWNWWFVEWILTLYRVMFLCYFIILNLVPDHCITWRNHWLLCLYSVNGIWPFSLALLVIKWLCCSFDSLRVTSQTLDALAAGSSICAELAVELAQAGPQFTQVQTDCVWGLHIVDQNFDKDCLLDISTISNMSFSKCLQELRCNYAVKACRFQTALSILKDEFIRSRDYPRCPPTTRLFSRIKALGRACIKYYPCLCCDLYIYYDDALSCYFVHLH